MDRSITILYECSKRKSDIKWILKYQKNCQNKDVTAYFNKNYVNTEIFPRKLGHKIAEAAEIREDSDYDDEFIVKTEETEKK